MRMKKLKEFQHIKKSFRDSSFNRKELKMYETVEVITLERVVRNIVLHKKSTECCLSNSQSLRIVGALT